MWVIAAAFLVVQVSIIWLAANGPFVDEALYTVAGMRVLEGNGLADGYVTWFNGSPFAWPVIAALGHRLAGLAGARLLAAVVSTVTLVAFARTAEQLFGRSVARWCALALAINGLFMALAHFAVYDVAALAGLAVSMWCVARSSSAAGPGWVIGAAVAFAAAVICKYGYLPMVVPLLGLLVSVRGARHSWRGPVVFLVATGLIVGAYCWLFFGALVPTSSVSYLGQTFGRTRGHIAALQVVFGLAPLALASAGALVAWRRGQRWLAATVLLAVLLYPAFHLWTANFVSAQKHVVAGFLFAYLLAGLALERLWAWRPRAAVVVLALLAGWGGLQCYWQDRSWSDIRPLAQHLVAGMKRGERVVAESSWSYTLYLYPAGLIESPAAVIDANYGPARDGLDICQVRWLAGNLESAGVIRDAVSRCRHQRVLSSITHQYYVDTSRLWVGTSPVLVGLYRLPDP